MAYGAWSYRDLPVVTNNQANCMVVNAASTPMELYVTNESYARSVNALTFYSESYQAWFVKNIAR